MILRSESGNLRYGVGALQGLWQRAVDGRLAGGVRPESSLTSIGILFRRLTLVIDAFEDALRDPSLQEEVAKQLPLLNQTYGALLLKLHAELLTLKDRLISASCARPFLGLDVDKYIPIYRSQDTYEWVAAQFRLVGRLGGVQDKATRLWAGNLIEWQACHKEEDVWWMKAVNLAPLQEEAQTAAPDIVARAKAENWFG